MATAATPVSCHAVIAACLFLFLTACSGSDQENQAPIANAGPDVTARFQSDVVLSGRDSDDADGPVMQQLWRQVSGPEVPVQVVNTTTIRLKLPAFEQETQLVWELTVTDNKGATSSDQVVVTAKPPIDPDRFLTFFNTPSSFNVDVPLGATQATLPAPVGFDVVLTAKASYRDLQGVQQEVTFNVQRQAGQWTPEMQAQGLAPRFTLAIPAVDLEQLANVNEAARNELAVVYELGLENLTAAVQFDLNILDSDGAAADLSTLSAQSLGGFQRRLKHSFSSTAVTGEPIRIDRDRLLDALKVAIVESARTAEAYYRAIDPENRKTTLKDWLRENGFDRNDAVEAKYINAGDLGFGRHMFVRQNEQGHLFAVVTNYPNMDSLVDGINIVATVAMEYSPGPSGGPPFTKFYTFVPNRETGSQDRVLSMDFDGRGDKYTPGNCAVCHGGKPKALVNGEYPDEGDIGSRFLPWDAGSFAFSDAEYEGRTSLDPTNVSRASEEAAFKYYNRALLGTNLTDSSRDLIHGWYGGESMPNAVADDSYVPLAWRSPADGGPESNPATATELYRDVFAHSCRACHTGREGESSSIGFASYQQFAENRERILQFVFDEGLMPAARVTMDSFWINPTGKSRAQLLAEHFSTDSQQRQPGKPQALITPQIQRGTSLQTLPSSSEQSEAKIQRGDILLLSAAESRFVTSQNWTLQAPPNSQATLASTTSTASSFKADKAGTFEVRLTGLGQSSQTSEASYRLVVDNLIPVAGAFSGSTKQGQSIGFNVYNTPSSLGDGARANHRIVGVSAVNGNVTVDQTAGTIQFAPAGTQDGSFSYRLEDIDGDQSDPATVGIVVSDLPVASNDSLDAKVGAAIANSTLVDARVKSFSLATQVFQNDNLGTVPTVMIGNPVRISGSLRNGLISNCPGQGDLRLVGANLEYTPPIACTGTEVWRYTLRDANGDTSSADITLTVTTTDAGSFTQVTDLINKPTISCAQAGCHSHETGHVMELSGSGAATPEARSCAIFAQIIECNLDPSLPDCSAHGARIQLTAPAPADDLTLLAGTISTSVLLRKPLGEFLHSGGNLLVDTSSDNYKQLFNWIAEGAHGPVCTP